MLLRQLKTLVTLSIALAATACGSDSTAPPSPLVGSYTALEWTTTGTSGQTHQLVIGSTLTINLNADASTTGHMHVAASNGQPAADFDLAGQWSASSTAVAFIQTDDNFLNDMIFALEPIANDVWDLVGDDTFSGTRVELRLRKTP